MPNAFHPGRRRATVAPRTVLLVLLASACAATRDEPPAPQPAPPAAGSELSIQSLREEPAHDASLVKLVGTVVNRGAEPADRVSVRVEARDPQGRALTRIIVSAYPDTIVAGGAGTFEVDVPKSAAVHDYHAEVVAR